MIDLAVESEVPRILRDARSIWLSALRLYGSVKCRRRELEMLLACCLGVLQQLAEYVDERPATDDVKSTVAHIQDVFGSVKGLVATVGEKGFLWSLMNAAKFDYEYDECVQDMSGIRDMLLPNIITLPTPEEVRLAREEDRKDLAQIFESSKNGNELLVTIQKRESTHRTGEEIFVALRKYAQDHPLKSNARVEDIFLHKVSEILRKLYDVKDDVAFKRFVISSLEVDFDVNNPIGRGASGKVYKGAWNGTTVAIKRMHSDDGRMLSREQRQAFYHELRTWSELRHPNVLPFYGACLEAEIPFLLMKHCRFGTVNSYLEQYPDADRIKLSRSIAAGLSYLHSQKIVHADIKGANVLIGDDHDALLSDFGLALRLHDYRSQTSFSTEMDRRRGTLVYMAPEVLEGGRPDEASDVYSLGLTVWQMFSDGRVPYANFLSSNILMERVVDEGYRENRPRRMTQDHVWALLQKCWATRPDDRPTAKDVSRALTPSSRT
ncbi:hypothetical protein NM688_g7207 [Phlebia brevispora]|uniref:Uncharacterized protein n=1 Tax=Phlebia brevispora TaxID=194682 RepID=A0ACC1S841_9APHY|nr:hypothetical protein NM688_g7207 [Phlebia brevispora]